MCVKQSVREYICIYVCVCVSIPELLLRDENLFVEISKVGLLTANVHDHGMW